MPEYSVKNIVRVVNGKLIGQANISVSNILTDSRRLIFPSQSLFFAIKGERHDGHDYIKDLYDIGVRAFIINDLPAQINDFTEACFIKVDDSIKALQDIAAYHRRQFNIPVVGVTGSNGKTIVKEWVFEVLHEFVNVIRSPKSYNSQIGVPLSVLLLSDDHEVAFFEAGISEPGEMRKLEPIIQPHIGLITNIGEAHQENFNSIQEKINEKLDLFENSRIIVYCKDHEEIDKQIQLKFGNKENQLFTWARNKDSDLRINLVEKKGLFTIIEGIYKKQTVAINIPFTDDASVENSIHVVALLISMGYDVKEIGKGITRIAPVAMRLEQKKGINNCTLINDSYNSDITSLHIAIDYLVQQNQHSNKIVILSDILQSGRKHEDLYKEISGYFKGKGIDKIVGIGKHISKNKNLFTINAAFYETTEEFIFHFSEHQFYNSAILLKGARGFAFEKISRLLELKIHKTVFEINLDALVHNLNVYRSMLEPLTKIMVMVKAFSYGSGSYEIANLLQFQRVDYLGVAFSDEGIALRKSGIKLPIIVLNPEQSSFDSIIKNELEPEIFNFEGLKQFSELLRQYGFQSYPVHIKLDTGMHRLGFGEKDIPKLLEELDGLDNVVVKSIFSHLAASGDSTHDDFSRKQIKLFEKLSDLLISRLGYKVIRHILNSGGIEGFLDAQYDMVRLGIGLYGVSNRRIGRLKNVGTLKSYISQLKEIPPNETVGYGREWSSKKSTTLAVVPIGYADGLSRNLSNGVGKFLVNGKFAPIIGNICMDMCMIDITNINVKVGDEVIVFGEGYSIIHFARQMGTIPYEVLTNISSRVTRVYYQE